MNSRSLSPNSAALQFAAKRDLYVWTGQNRMIGQNRFGIIPPLRGLYMSRRPEIIVIKSAQVMVSEFLINTALWTCATGQGERGNGLYIFPHERQIRDFSQARVNKAISDSPLIHKVTEKPFSTFLKKIGPGHLYMRGAQTRDSLLSIDADLVICDEIAQYEADTINFAQKRLGSSKMGWTRCASTPRFPKDEAGLLWEQSTQMHYAIPCSHCATKVVLTIEHLDPERAILVCPHCKGDMTADRLLPGEWVPDTVGRPWEGFHLTKLLSPLTDLAKLARFYLRVLEGRATTGEVAEFWNSEAGEPYLPEGGHLDFEDLEACVDPTWEEVTQVTSGDGDTAEVVMGVDVGTRIHVVIYRLREGKLQVLSIQAVWSFEDLDDLMHRFRVRVCVIDANPDTRKAQEFAQAWPRKVWLAYYPNIGEGREVGLCVWKDQQSVVHIRRTVALDRVQSLVTQRLLILPRGAAHAGGDVDRSGQGEYYRHMQSPIRVLEMDAAGNTVAHYERNGPDHYCVVAGTLVETTAGPLPIEQLTPGLRVMTRGGPRPVQRAWMTAAAAEVCVYTFSNGALLTATPDHPVFVPGRGFVPIGELGIGTIISTWEQWTHASIKASPSGATPRARGGATASTSPPEAATAGAACSGSTRKSGAICTGLSRLAMWCITKTRIPSTTRPRTLSCAPAAPISATMRGRAGRPSRPADARGPWRPFAPSLLRGISPLTVWLSTASMPGRSPAAPLRSPWSARSAAGTIGGGGVPTHQAATIAHGPARPRRAAPPAWMTNSASVPSVTPRSSSIAIATNGPARALAGPVCLVSSRPGGTAAVYNLTVAETHEYFANGVLVSNCHASVYALAAASRLAEIGDATVATATPLPERQSSGSSIMEQAASVFHEMRQKQQTILAKLMGNDPEEAEDDEVGGIAVAGGRRALEDPVGTLIARYYAQTIRQLDSKEDSIETARFPPL